ncbi:MAG TPA: hypothetical protein PLV55_06115 [Anaerohalosphaeraceae bacterium]|nr:hypothetical protein [Anaerohalosphaeraceae bacterium]
MFLNVSNHPSDKWSDEQKEAALKLADGPIIDIPFPDVPPEADRTEAALIADKLYDEVMQVINQDTRGIFTGNHAVMIMGEYSVFHKVVKRIQANPLYIPVYVATTKRIAEETKGVKKSVFQFVRFREIK